jgi:hypothetical protein
MMLTGFLRPRRGWRKSSFCAHSECAELAGHGGRVLVRNNTRPSAVAELSPEAWRELLAGMKAGEFD